VETTERKNHKKHHRKTKMKILVIGNKGMLGTDLIKELKKTDYEIIGWDLGEIDITNPKDMHKIEDNKPDIIINCAAYTDVDEAESKKDLAFSVNVTGVNNLAKICIKLNIPLMHISTDYVFNGQKEKYNEDDTKDPINYYGKTKAESEDIIVNSLEKYYIIRTSWLFGKNGKNFVETMKKLLTEKNEIKVVDDQKGKPTYTKDLAKAMINLITEKKDFGIYHCTNEDTCTWFEFALQISDYINSKCKINPCTTKEFPRPAERPRFSILKNNKTMKIRGWKEALKAYLEE